MGDISGYLNKQKLGITDIAFSAANLAKVVLLIEEGKISGKQAKDKFPELLEGKSPDELFKGEEKLSDPTVLEPIIDQVIADNPKELEKYRAGRNNLLGFFVGQVMKQTGGRADPKLTNQLLTKKLNG